MTTLVTALVGTAATVVAAVAALLQLRRTSGVRRERHKAALLH